MAENKLQNTILVDGVEYDIHAVYSEDAGHSEKADYATEADTAVRATNADKAGKADQAGKVENALSIKESGTQVFTFDGSAPHEIDYVSAADGGKFSNPVLIDNQYPNLQNVPDQAIINFSQINDLVHALKAAPLYKWVSSAQLESYIGSNNALQGLNIVVGTTEDLDSFKRFAGVILNATATPSSARYYGMSMGKDDTASGTKSVIMSYTDTDHKYTDVFIPTVAYPICYADGTTNLTKGFPVTRIYENAFMKNTDIERIIIPKSVNTIGNQAFMGCTGLKMIELPSALEIITTRLFKGCTGLSEVVIGKNVTEVWSNAFSGCTSLSTVYYEGTEEDWAKISISSGNDLLKTASRVYNYKYSADFRDLPCLYVCVDNTTYTSNKMFLKLPESGLLIDMTQEANRLASQSISQNYYTYEGLAEIIARINVRLDALGGTDLKITNTALTTIPSIEDVNAMVPNVEIKEELNPNSIPTVQSLSDKIDKLRGDLDDLAREVDIELNREDNDLNIRTRLLKVEEAIKTLSGTADKLTLKDIYGEVTLEAEELRKIKALIGAIDWP